ncbi:unnamed protein product [Penicillium discolor]
MDRCHQALGQPRQPPGQAHENANTTHFNNMKEQLSDGAGFDKQVSRYLCNIKALLGHVVGERLDGDLPYLHCK